MLTIDKPIHELFVVRSQDEEFVRTFYARIAWDNVRTTTTTTEAPSKFKRQVSDTFDAVTDDQTSNDDGAELEQQVLVRANTSNIYARRPFFCHVSVTMLSVVQATGTEVPATEEPITNDSSNITPAQPTTDDIDAMGDATTADVADVTTRTSTSTTTAPSTMPQSLYEMERHRHCNTAVYSRFMKLIESQVPGVRTLAAAHVVLMAGR